MNFNKISNFRLIPIYSTIFASSLHFYWGAPRALLYYQSGIFTDWRPYALTLSAIAIWSVLFIFRNQVHSTQIYIFCSTMMSIHIFGYCMWHLFGHPIFNPSTGSLSFHSHPNTTILTILEHLQHDLFALGTMMLEICSVFLFLYLVFQSRNSN